MNYLEKIKSSIYNPVFYRQIPKKTFSSAITYYLLLCLLLTIIQVVSFAVPVTTGINQLTTNIDQKVISAYPQNLDISIHNGIVQTNVQEPYAIPFSSINTNSDEKTNIIVIDTKTPFSQKQFDAYNTYVWLTRDTLFYKDTGRSEVRAYDLSTIKNFTLNKNIVQNTVDKISPWLKFLAPAILVLAFLGIYIAYLLQLIYFLLLAFIFWLIAKKIVQGLSYRDSYKTTLHAVTLGMLISVLLEVTNPFLHLWSFPFLGTILAIIIFVINVRNTETVKVVRKSRTPRRSTKK